jgi:abequosyltransferase
MTDLSAPLLSICVPTYKRAALLKECLASMIDAAANHEHEVEIVISDNASPDETLQVASAFRAERPWIRYNRNDVNIGEQNFYRVAQLAAGKYLWLFSDDDKMAPAAISQALDYIRAGHRLVVMNYSVWARDYSFIKISHRYARTRSCIFNDPNLLLKHLGEKITFISSSIIDRDLFLGVDQRERDSLAEYGHSYMYVIYSAAAACRQIAYHGTPLVLCRGDNSIMPPDVWNKVFILGPAYTLKALSYKGFSRTSIYAAKNGVLKDLVFKAILYRKREGISTQGLFTYILSEYKTQWAFWFICVPAMLTPRFVPHLATRLLRLVRRWRHQAGFGIGH